MRKRLLSGKRTGSDDLVDQTKLECLFARHEAIFLAPLLDDSSALAGTQGEDRIQPILIALHVVDHLRQTLRVSEFVEAHGIARHIVDENACMTGARTHFACLHEYCCH